MLSIFKLHKWEVIVMMLAALVKIPSFPVTENISHFPISFEIIAEGESRRSRCRKRQVPKKK